MKELYHYIHVYYSYTDDIKHIGLYFEIGIVSKISKLKRERCKKLKIKVINNQMKQKMTKIK